VGRETALWGEIEKLISGKKQKEYDRAVDLVKDLRDLGERTGKKSKAEAAIRDLCERHSGKSSLMRRLRAAGLTK
jgi:hypothetical protein